MSEFWMWFWRPLAEFVGGLFAFCVLLAMGAAVILIAHGVYSVRDWLQARRTKPPEI